MSTALALPQTRPGLLRLARDAMRFRSGDFSGFENLIDQYGDINAFRVGPMRFWYIGAPEGIQDVLVRHHASYKKDKGFAALRYILGNGLLTSEGEFHLRQRRMIQPAFHKERIAAYGRTMAEYAVADAALWKDGEERDVHADMMALTLRIAGKTLFDADVAEDAETVAHSLEELFQYHELHIVPWFGKLLEFLRVPAAVKVQRAMSQLDATIYRIIDAHRKADASSGSLLAMLLEARDEDDGSRMSDSLVRDEALTLFLAGHETTAVAMSWTWYLLSQNPDVEAELHAELDRVLDGRPPTVEDVPNLVYTRQVFSESMRLYPPAYGFGREATADNEVCGHQIRKGDTVLLSPYLVQRNPRIWPNPERFDPTRWTPDAVASRHKFAYFPFGGGQRKCIGEAFAWMEGVLLVAAVAQRWRYRHAPEHTVSLDPKITLRPRYGMRMTLHAR